MRFWVVFAFAAGLTARSWADPVHEAATEQRNFRTELDNTLRRTNPLDFESWVKGGERGLCRFGDLCEYFRANSTNAYLYRTSEGAIPNYSLWALEESVAACIKTKNEFSGDLPNRKARIDAYVQTKKLQAQSFQKLQASLSRHRENDIYMQLQKAMFDSLADGTNPLPKTLADTRDPSKATALVNAELDWYQKRIHKSLSPESRAAYVQFALHLNGVLSVKPKFQPAWEGLNHNPFLDFTQLLSAEVAGGTKALQANRQRYDQRLQLSANIFAATQKEIIAMLDQRRTPENAAAIDAMKERIRTVSFGVKPVTMDFRDNPTCADGPNAFYSLADHSMNLCPQILEQPPAALKSVIAHELGHAIDPCTMSYNFLHLKLKGKPGPDNSDPDAYKPHLSSPPPKYTFSVLPPEMILNGRPNLSLYSPGQSAEPDANTPGMHPSEYPLGSVVRCLNGPQSIGARFANPQKVLQPLYQDSENLIAAGANPKNSQRLRKNLAATQIIQQQLTDQIACSSLPGPRSQMSEAFADWVSSKIMDNEVAAALTPEAKRRVALETMSFDLVADCSLDDNNLHRKAEMLIAKVPECNRTSEFIRALDQASLANEMANNSYPVSYLRTERIYLASPALQSALGCTPPKGLVQCD
ncbi:MAG: hypothetical protein JST16_09145 [Bdellovibrionales bacterium]|nr:hypothetical protein [Bdellovibrionales bacterium]